jgi:phosphoserine phosphatase
MDPQSVLVTIAGRDRPGVTAALFSALAAHDTEIEDVEQVVIRGRLVLGVLVAMRGEVSELRRSVLHVAQALGLDSEVIVADAQRMAQSSRHGRHHVILLGHPLRPGAIGHVAQSIADIGANIDSITQLAHHPLDSLEMTISNAQAHDLRTALAQATSDTGIDIAIEPAGLARRAKRLVVLDVDSTLVQGEGIDLLAERAGTGDQVAAITAAAMAGELDFEQSVRARVRLLAGLPIADVHAVRDALILTPGARTLVRTLRRLGYHVGVVSGGFTVLTDRFVQELGLDFAAANELEIRDGRLTGGLVGDIVDRRGKADALRRFAQKFGVPLAQTVAIGDGANDIDMIEAAGLGIAFNAKAALRRSADTAVNHPFLDSVLFVLGVSRAEADEADEVDEEAEDEAG